MAAPFWLQVAWTYLKRFWGIIPFGFLLVFVILFARDKNQAINDLLKNQQQLSEKHRQDLAELQQIRDDERRKREEIEAQYRVVLDQINVQHQEAIARLTRQQETELRQIVAETKDDPDAMAARVNTLFNFPILPPTHP